MINNNEKANTIMYQWICNNAPEIFKLDIEEINHQTKNTFISNYDKSETNYAFLKENFIGFDDDFLIRMGVLEGVKMEKIKNNLKIIKQIDYLELLEALIYMEIESEGLKEDEELAKKIKTVAYDWFKSDYVHLLPDEIKIKIENI